MLNHARQFFFKIQGTFPHALSETKSVTPNLSFSVLTQVIYYLIAVEIKK